MSFQRWILGILTSTSRQDPVWPPGPAWIKEYNRKVSSLKYLAVGSWEQMPLKKNGSDSTGVVFTKIHGDKTTGNSGALFAEATIEGLLGYFRGSKVDFFKFSRTSQRVLEFQGTWGLNQSIFPKIWSWTWIISPKSRVKMKKTSNHSWWKKSYTSWCGKFPIIYRVLYIPGGAGCLPSTVPPCLVDQLMAHCLGRWWFEGTPTNPNPFQKKRSQISKPPTPQRNN